MTKNKSLIEKLNNERLLPVLETIQLYGLTSHKVVRSINGLADKQAAYAFTKLQEYGVIAPLRSATVYAAKNGRPEKPFALTPTGISALNEMGYDKVRRLDLDGPLDVSHRLCMALVGSQSANPVRIEKVIPYAQGRYVRTDVSVPLDNGNARLIEIEQELNDKRRAITKLKGYAELFATNPSGIIPEVMIIFNLPVAHLERTLKVWQSALRDVSELSLTVYYSSLADFLAVPDFKSWDGLKRLTPSEKKHKQRESVQIAGELPEENPHNEVPMADMVKQVAMIKTKMTLVSDDEDAERLFHLGALAYSIHQLDFNQENGRTLLYAAHPANSLELLWDFLHHPTQQPLLELLRSEIKNFNKQNGITMLRNSATRLAWSFLHYFGFGRGGPLTLYVRVPEMGDNISEISFELQLYSDQLKMPDRPEEYMKAISWLMSALIIHSEELGLIER